ncbi:hypothetical protein CTA21_23960 [Salmonella enterica]|nr:hypothetical protein [Salmonella enterica]
MIRTMLERLLGHLHRAVFDTSPDEVVAFMLDGPAGSSWVAKDENFDITFADGRKAHFDLNNYTMNQLAVALLGEGMKVTNVNDDTRHFSGITMLELEGKAGRSQPVTLYKDILHAVFGAYSREMRAAKTAVMEGIDQLYIPKASDGFLNTWGNLFGVPRGTEKDEEYRIEIPREAFRLRVNSYAIEQAVKEQTNYEITLEEPWRDVFRLDKSFLSGANKFYNYNDVGYFIVQPVTYIGADWDVVMPIIERNLAAGVVALKPQARGRFWVNDPLYGKIWWQVWTQWGTFVQTDTQPRLDNNLVLSGGYDFQINYSVAITSDWVLDNIGDPLKGSIWYIPAHNLSYFADAGVQPIYTYHTGTYAGAYLELYPTTPRDWMSGGWERDSTWGMPYNWRAFFRASQNESQFFADGSGIVAGITVSAFDGETWEDLAEWNDRDWLQGTEPFFPLWYDASNNFTPVETDKPNEWEMDVSRKKKALFNVGIRCMVNRQSTQTLPGIPWKLTLPQPSNVAAISTVNDHTWSINTTGLGDIVLKVSGTDTSGHTMESQLTIHVKA